MSTKLARQGLFRRSVTGWRLRWVGLFLGLFWLLGARPAHAGKCPNLIIILDKSGSMADAPAGGPAPPGGSKWELATLAIKELLKTYDGQLPIGLSLFAGDNDCAAGNLDIAPGYGTADKINALIAMKSADSATPTSETVSNLATQAVLHDPSRSQYMLLLTDGEPNCAGNEPDATVNALTAARMQSPSITTFVVGFGALPPGDAMAMDRMAVAGGAPAVGTTSKFYVAEDLTSLKDALEKIFTVVLGEGQGLCDDSCYAPDVGCPMPGDTCIRGKCAPSPCDGVFCGPGYYCYTDGVLPGRCIAPCKKSCGTGYRCEQGLCIATACPSVCIAGFVCNAQSGRCEPDPLCPDNPPRQDQCRVPSACQFGTCVDDPCKFIKCPSSSRCVPWDGSCEFAPGFGPQVDMASNGNSVDVQNRQAGCAIGGMAAGPGFILTSLLVLVALLLSRRSRA